MSNLEQYIESIREYIASNPDISETELIRHVYFDLGKRFSFDSEFLPFGNTKKRQHIYKHCEEVVDLEECMETNIVICKSVAHILEHVLKPFGVNIRTVKAKDDSRRCPHVYNVIKPQKGEPYIVDLQEDMYNIQSHSFTKNFGLSLEDDGNFVISRLEQEEMDRKSGYIDDEHYYANDYIYLLKLNMSYFQDFGERVRFVLENINAYDVPSLQYTDRQWHHVRILEQLFSPDEFDYRLNNKKIRMIDCYKDVNNERRYINFISVQTGNTTQMYVYNNKTQAYAYMSLEDFAKAVKNGLVVHNCNVPGLNHMLKNLNEGR